MPFKLLLSKINHFKSNVTFVKYFSNISWLFFSKLISLFSNIFVGAWVARYLGTESFGFLNYSNSLASLFLPIALIGLNDIVVKELVKKNDDSKTLETAFFLKLIFGLISFFLLFIFTFIVNDDCWDVKILIFIFSFFLVIQSLEVFDFYFQSKVKSKFVVYSRLCSILVGSTTKIILIRNNSPIIYFALVMVLEQLITHLITFLFFLRNNTSFLLLNFDKKTALKQLKKSWPLFLSGLMYVLYIKIDQIMVKEFLGAHSAGIYAVSINLSEVWYFIPNIIASSFFPSILIHKNKNKVTYYKSIEKLYSVLFIISLLIALFTFCFGQQIIDFLYGYEYHESYKILSIYIWSNIFFFLTTISSKWIVAEGLYIHSFYRNLSGVILNITLNFILLNKYGLIGAAISTLIAYSFVGLFYDLLFKKLRVNFKLKMKALFFFKKTHGK